MMLLPFLEVTRSLATTTQPCSTDILHHCWRKATHCLAPPSAAKSGQPRSLSKNERDGLQQLFSCDEEETGAIEKHVVEEGLHLALSFWYPSYNP